MSGHSKWHNIKLRKGKVDAQRGALFTKLSKEIILAAKGGSADPDANYRLKMAVDKARANNMPQDNIKRAIARASGAGEREIEELRYEGYGPGNVAVIIDAATDNRNRTASELRFIFSRNGGTLGETGTVGWMFAPRGLIEVEPNGLTEDDLTEKALVDGVIDVRLTAAGVHVTGAQLGFEPTQSASPPPDELARVVSFLDALEEHEDVARVYSNAELDEAALEALA